MEERQTSGRFHRQAEHLSWFIFFSDEKLVKTKRKSVEVVWTDGRTHKV